MGAPSSCTLEGISVIPHVIPNEVKDLRCWRDNYSVVHLEIPRFTRDDLGRRDDVATIIEHKVKKNTAVVSRMSKKSFSTQRSGNSRHKITVTVNDCYDAP